jgi:hypothetical protein
MAKKPQKAFNQVWWAQEENAHQSLISLIKRVQGKNNSTESLLASYASQYLNRPISSLSIQFSNPNARNIYDSSSLRYNVIKSCVDAAAAKVAKSRPRVQFLTTRGDYKQQKNAEKLTQYCDGLFHQLHLYETAQQAFIDAAVLNLGVLKICHDGQTPIVERVLPTEIFVNQNESLYGKPTNLYQIKHVDRYVLLDMFPEKEKQILAAAPSDPLKMEEGDMIPVHEAWHIGSQGRHVIAIQGADLVNEPYTKKDFPFVFFRWNQPLIGFYGVGIAEELLGIQIEINEILSKIQKSIDLVAVPRVYVETNSKIEVNQVTNDIGAIVEYSGNMPSFQTHQAMTPEVYGHLDRLFSKAYEITGISQLSASSMKPSGLDSGVAIREFQDIESERFSLVSQRWERLFVDVAEKLIDVTQELVELGVKPKIKVAQSKFVQEIKWSELNWSDDAFILQPFASSLLPTTPAGKLQKVIELMDRGLLSQAEGKRLLEFPDLKSVSINSPFEDAMSTVDAALEQGVYESPEPGQDLDTLITLGTSKYLEARRSKYPEERLEILRKIIEDAKALKEEMSPPPQPPLEGVPQ